jgi:hypothetical protein
VAIVAVAVLYGVDAVWFNGWYFAALKDMLSQIYVHW